MHLAYQSLAVILLVGLVAGWMAAKFMTKCGMGIVGDVIVGVIDEPAAHGCRALRLHSRCLRRLAA